MAFIHSIISWATIKRMNQIELFEKYPEDVQNEQLFNIVNFAKNTKFGKKYDFASINSMQMYKAKPGDIVLCLGAGTITQWAYALPGQLEAHEKGSGNG